MTKSLTSGRYKFAILAAAVVWKMLLIGILFSRGGAAISAAVLLFAIGLLPYVVLLLVAPYIERTVWVGAAIVVAVLDILAGLGAILPKSSTDVIAIGLVPLYDIFLVVPGAWLLGNALPRLIRRWRRR